MGCRRQSRTATALAVNLCGTDASGRAFIERVITHNISRDGALLEGVRWPVRTGDIVVVRCADQTGRFRVIWERPDGGGTRCIGLARLSSASRIEDLEASDTEPDTYLRPRKLARRMHPRFKCEVAAELRLKDIRTPMWVTSTNLSEEGCSVNTMVSVPAMTELTIAMWLGQEKVWAQGVVVSSLYGMGTGIRFTSLSRQGKEHLREFLHTQKECVTDRRAEADAVTPVPTGTRREANKKDAAEFTVSIPLVIYEDTPVLG